MFGHLCVWNSNTYSLADNCKTLSKLNFYSADIKSKAKQNLCGLWDFRMTSTSRCKTDSTVHTQHWQHCYGSLRTQTWQEAEAATQEVTALSMTNTTDVRWVYQTPDRPDDRTDRTQRPVCLVTIFQQPPPTPISTVSHWQRGHWLQGVFVMGCWKSCYSVGADGKRLSHSCASLVRTV